MSEDGPKRDLNDQIQRNYSYSAEPQPNIKAEQVTLGIFLVSCLVSCYTTFSFYFCSLQCCKFTFFLTLKLIKLDLEKEIFWLEVTIQLFRKTQDITWVPFLFQQLKGENSLLSSFRVATALLKTTFMHRKLSLTKSLSNNNYHIAFTI